MITSRDVKINTIEPTRNKGNATSVPIGITEHIYNKGHTVIPRRITEPIIRNENTAMNDEITEPKITRIKKRRMELQYPQFTTRAQHL